MWLNRGGEETPKGVVAVRPDHSDANTEEHICPVCGTQIAGDSRVRRCPRCRAKVLWREGRTPEPPVDYGTVLFNTRLCGIMAGIQVGMIALLLTGYRLPLPWGIALVMLASPFAGYYLASFAAASVPASWRTGLLVAALALNAGLMVALIGAVTGISDPIVLAAIAVGIGFAIRPFIERAVKQGTGEDR